MEASTIYTALDGTTHGTLTECAKHERECALVEVFLDMFSTTNPVGTVASANGAAKSLNDKFDAYRGRIDMIGDAYDHTIENAPAEIGTVFNINDAPGKKKKTKKK
jgi:hypothetical protein